MKEDQEQEHVWFKRPAAKGEEEDWEFGTIAESDSVNGKVLVKGSLQQLRPGLLLQKQKGHGADAWVAPERVVPANHGAVQEDMTSLRHTHEAAILHNLEQRSVANAPYTFLGTVLIGVNPVIDVGDPKHLLGSHKAMNQAHPYGIAERAFQQMCFASKRTELRELQPNQSIIVSGESGSGKTESSKRVVRHLVARCAPSRTASQARYKGKAGEQGLSSLEQALLDASPVLESFGNALTLSNHNSSRFGKLTRLFFADATAKEGKRLECACIDTYLLEKSRATSHAHGERNFHVFYRLLAGASAEERAAMGLPDASDSGSDSGDPWQAFRILKTRDVADWVFDNDVDAYALLAKGLASLDVSAHESARLMQVVAALLHLGNVDFCSADDRDGKFCDGDGDGVDIAEADPATAGIAPLERAASLLGVGRDVLKGMLVQRTIFAAGEKLLVQLSIEEARHARDGLLRAVYAALFDWVIARTNASFLSSHGSTNKQGSRSKPNGSASASSSGSGSRRGQQASHSIGVLDIFGFECFERNGLEQLLINFTNEALQKTFSEQVLVAEATLYRDEGLLVRADSEDQDAEATAAAMADSLGCTELLQGRRGVLRTIDDLTATPQPMDAKLLSHLHRSFAAHSHYTKPNPRLVNSHFVIHHFVGNVSYSIAGFVEKNVDKVPADVVRHLCESSDSLIVAKLFAQAGAGAGAGARAESRAAGERKPKPKGLASTFANEIQRLVQDLEATNCSFIRCIKPNAALQRHSKRDWFHRVYVAHQLRYLSIPQTAKVLSSGGFPTRIAYDDVFASYSSALPAQALDDWRKIPSRASDYLGFTRALFFALDVDPAVYKFGLTKVFFRKGALATVEAIFAKAGEAGNQDAGDASAVAKRFSLFHARLCWRRCFAKVAVANHFLGLLRDARRRAHAATTVGRFMATLAARKAFVRTRNAVRTLQRTYRGAAVRRVYAPILLHLRQERAAPTPCALVVAAVSPVAKRVGGTAALAPSARSPSARSPSALSPSRKPPRSPGGDGSQRSQVAETARVQQLELEVGGMRQALNDMQVGQQTMLRMMEESQRRERLLLEEHFRLLRRLEKAANPPKRIRQDSAWSTLCVFGRCYKEAE